MQFSTVAVLAAAATTVSAGYGYSNATGVVYTTDVVTAFTTYCPEATQITFGESTYTVTDSTTLTITNCPCTVVKPVTTSSVVYCNTCSSAAPTYPVYSNATSATSTYAAGSPPASSAASSAASTSAGSVGTTSAYVASPTPSAISANSGNKAVAVSGFSLAGLLAFAAYVL